MSIAYYCELAHRTTSRLALLPGELRDRIPEAWDHGMSLIGPDLLPDGCTIARKGLIELRSAMNKNNDRDATRIFGAAHSNTRGLHNYPTLVRFAQLMLNIEADLRRHFDSEQRVAIESKGPKS